MLIRILEARDPDVTVLYQNNRAVTARELAAKAAALAGALAAHNVGEGDRVALILPNCKELVLALAACARIGAVAAPLDPAATGPELGRALAPLAPRCAFVLGRGCEALAQGVRLAEASPPLVVKIDRDVESPGSRDGVLFLDDLLATRLPVPAAPPERAAFLALAAWRGRGRPHFTILRADATLACAEAAARATGIAAALRDGGALLAAGPFFRPGPLTLHVLAPLVIGVPFVVLKQLRARMALKLAHAHPVRAVVAPPALLTLMARLVTSGADRAPGDVRSWVATAAPPPSPEQVESVERVFGRPLAWGYGSAELPWVLVVPEERRRLPAAARGLGEPIAPQVELHLVEGGAVVPAGRPGSILVRSPWAARELLAEAAEDRPTPLGIATGDRGVRGPDGALQLLPREDTCTVAAYDVDLVEVAAALQEHPSVALASAYWVPDPDTGANVRAVVTLAPGTEASVASLVEFLRPRLAYYKLPQSFRFKRIERPN